MSERNEKWRRMEALVDLIIDPDDLSDAEIDEELRRAGIEPHGVADRVLLRVADLHRAMAPDQPPPSGGEGDCWEEVIADERDPIVASMMRERRQMGIDRYGQPLRRGDGRDHRVDLVQELLDAVVYARAARAPAAERAARAALTEAVWLLSDSLDTLDPADVLAERAEERRTARDLLDSEPPVSGWLVPPSDEP